MLTRCTPARRLHNFPHSISAHTDPFGAKPKRETRISPVSRLTIFRASSTGAGHRGREKDVVVVCARIDRIWISLILSSPSLSGKPTLNFIGVVANVLVLTIKSVCLKFPLNVRWKITGDGGDGRAHSGGEKRRQVAASRAYQLLIPTCRPFKYNRGVLIKRLS